MRTPDIVANELRAYHDSLGDELDQPSVNEQVRVKRLKMRVQEHISLLADLPSQMADAVARLEPLMAERDLFLATEQKTAQDIAAVPDFSKYTDARERDKQAGYLKGLEMRLKMLRAGQLIVAGGVRLRPLEYVDGQIERWTRRRDELQEQLEYYVRSADDILAAAKTVTTV